MYPTNVTEISVDDEGVTNQTALASRIEKASKPRMNFLRFMAMRLIVPNGADQTPKCRPNVQSALAAAPGRSYERALSRMEIQIPTGEIIPKNMIAITTSIGVSAGPMVLDWKVIGTTGSHPLHLRRSDAADAACPKPNE